MIMKLSEGEEINLPHVPVERPLVGPKRLMEAAW